MPIDPGFENPQSAYVAIISDLGSWKSIFWECYSDTDTHLLSQFQVMQFQTWAIFQKIKNSKTKFLKHVPNFSL
jgi:hypothetical protein